MRPLRRRMQIDFPGPLASLNPRHSIGRILTEPLLLHGVVPDRPSAERAARAMLERVSFAVRRFSPQSP